MTDLVQPIAVLMGTHEETVHAAALASVLRLIDGAGRGESSWQEWLDGLYTKSVRRVKSQTAMDRLVAGTPHSLRVTIGNASAIAFEPTTEFSPEVKRLQVSGTEAERSGVWPFVGLRGPLVVINSQVAMTTGKTAAQVAHGLMGWFLRASNDERQLWVDHGYEFNITESDDLSSTPEGIEPDTDVLTIVDAGLTEVEPGTYTVRVWSPSLDRYRQEPIVRDLVKARRSRGLSVEEVAERIGATVAEVQSFESSDSDPEMSFVRRYALAVGATIDYRVETTL